MNNKYVSLLVHLIAPVLVLVGLEDLFLKIVEVAEEKTTFEFAFWDQTRFTYWVLTILGLFLGVFWFFRESRRNALPILHVWSERFIRVWLSFMISGYGFAKVLKTQFQVPEFIKDIPVGELHPFYLTWHYFGFSREYVLILAAVEIGGAVLLLFRQTKLLGACILFPTMLNIVFIDTYYHISPEALMAASFFTVGTVYLLLLDFDKLKVLLPEIGFSLSRINGYTIGKWMIRIVVLMSAFGLIWMYAHDTPVKDSFLTGVWTVESIQKNSQPVIEPNQRDSVLTKMYFERKRGQSIMEFNHRYNKQFTSYHLSEDQDSVLIDLEGDAMNLAVQRLDSGQVVFHGLHGVDTIRIVVSKVR